MPPRRKRRLSLSVPKAATTRALFNHNILDSALLKLPNEVQTIIYRHVLGDRLVHLRWIIDEEYARLIGIPVVSKAMRHAEDIDSARQLIGTTPWRHVVCSEEYPADAEYERHESCIDSLKYCYTEVRRAAYRRTVEDRRDDLIPSMFSSSEKLQLSLLRVCRLIYLNAINVYLETNTFSFCDPVTFRKWMTTQPVLHRNKLRHMRLDMDEWRNWNKDLKIQEVIMLSSLRSLRIHLTHTLRPAEVKNAKAGRYSQNAWRRLENVNAVVILANSLLENVELYVHGSGCQGNYESLLSKEAIQQHLSRNLRQSFLA